MTARKKSRVTSPYGRRGSKSKPTSRRVSAQSIAPSGGSNAGARDWFSATQETVKQHYSKPSAEVRPGLGMVSFNSFLKTQYAAPRTVSYRTSPVRQLIGSVALMFPTASRNALISHLTNLTSGPAGSPAGTATVSLEKSLRRLPRRRRSPAAQ